MPGSVVWLINHQCPIHTPAPLLTGTLPNITRNAIVNCAEMVTYDIIKEKLLDSHLLTGEAWGCWYTVLPSHLKGMGGTFQYSIGVGRIETWSRCQIQHQSSQ